MSYNPVIFADDGSGLSDMEMMQRYMNNLIREKAERDKNKVVEKAQEKIEAQKAKPAENTGDIDKPPEENANAGKEPSSESLAFDALTSASVGDPYGRTSPFGDGNWVYRRLPDPVGSSPDYSLENPYSKRDQGQQLSLDQFSAEYQRKLLDGGQEFKDWLAKRAMVLRNVDLYPDEGGFDVVGGQQLWNLFGNWTATNPYLRESYTPEEYADKLYEDSGGDATYDFAMEEKAANEPSPITKETTTSTSTVPKGAVEGSIDELSRGLLGRMASAKELARYRAKINAFLAANPNVTTRVRDATDPNNVITTSDTKAGATPQDALSTLEMKLRRGSEGMAYNIGQMFEDALAGMDKGL